MRLGFAALAFVMVAGPLATGTLAALPLDPLPDPVPDQVTVPVVATSFQFAPEALVIPAGSTVRWVHAHGLIGHTITTASSIVGIGSTPNDPNDCTADGTPDTFDCPLPFPGPLGAPGGEFSHTFNSEGTFFYFCKNHDILGGMRGVIVVAAV